MPNSKSNFWKVAIFSCLGISLSIYSCVPLGVLPDWKIGGDKFSRTYAVDFMSFHPKLNSALQDYAQKNKGNSFQVTRLGNDAVILQGLYKRDIDQGRLPTTITAKPVSHRKTRIEIKISSGSMEGSSEYLDRAARELFQIIERGTGIYPKE